MKNRKMLQELFGTPCNALVLDEDNLPFYFFPSINPAAYGFAFLCIIQAIIFVWLAVSGKVDFRYPDGLRGIVGSIVMIYALLIYPVIGHFLGHSYPNSPTFGAPCPTTIFTFGILLWSNKLPKYSLIIPTIWALIGFTAAFTMGIWEDTALPISAFATIFLLKSEKEQIRRNNNFHS
ncbi:MAG: hypothetical protein IPN18_21385 [Ignavibacteriales bacterium]|nr:hypothetical protein [Ignavibacteriales bacterium]